MRSSVSVILSAPQLETKMSYPDYEQIANDHNSILVLVKSTGPEPKNNLFPKVFDRICRVHKVKVTESSESVREIAVRYVKEYPVENNDWGDFQTHRRLQGLLSISKCSSQVELNEICRVHESLKVKYSATLIDSKCIVFGLHEDGKPVDDPSTHFTTPDIFKTRRLFYPDFELCTDLETHLNEFLCSLFWVLESKRLEKSREKVEKVALLMAPFEKKDIVGLDLESRTHRKRCVGRMTKHLGDLSLQCGLPGEAMNFYQSAIEVLRGVNDWLWLGAALEGMASASVIVTYPHLARNYAFQRNSSLQNYVPGKPRTSSFNSNSLPNGSLSIIKSEVLKSYPQCLSASDIYKFYREATLHYSKYHNAGIIETEACFKCARICIEQGMVLNAAMVLQNVVFINLQLNENEKILRFTTLATLYGEIGFHRKASFCSRLAATRCVSLQNPNPDWSQCYHHMLQALAGHKISLDPTEFPSDGQMGWPSLQVQLLQELVVAARRMNHSALVTRHMTFLIQTLWSQLTSTEQRDFALQLQSLSAQCEGAPVPLVLSSGVVIPPANLCNIPQAKSFQIENLSAPLRPQKIQKFKEQSGPFLFTPINFGSLERKAIKNSGKIDYLWVENEICEVTVKLYNPLPFELKVSDMRLLTTGVVFESIPVSISIPPETTVEAVLSGIPKEIGELEILGYSTHTLGVKSNCKLKYIQGMHCHKYIVEVIPSLAKISIATSLPKMSFSTSLGDPANIVVCGTLSLHAGESSECSITLTNIGQEPVELLEISVQTILEPEIQDLMFDWDKENLASCLPIEPGKSIDLPLKINATTDFLATSTDDGSLFGGASSQPNSLLSSGFPSVPSRANSPVMGRRAASSTNPQEPSGNSIGTSFNRSVKGSMRLPASPLLRLNLPCSSKHVEAQMKFRYSGGPGITSGYCRQCSASIALEIIPSVHITGWDVIPAETSSQFYLVLDVANMTNSELEMHYTSSKRILMEANESCRVPVPVERYRLPKLAERQSVIDDQGELERLCSEHIASTVDLKWILSSTEQTGKASLRGISLSSDMLDIVLMSPIQWDVTINSSPVNPQEEITRSIGENLVVGVKIKNASEATLKSMVLLLQCYQDFRNGCINNRMDSRMAFSGTDKIFIPEIEISSSIQHEYNLIFFQSGQYKISMVCLSQNTLMEKMEDYLRSGGHSWRYIPPIDLTITE